MPEIVATAAFPFIPAELSLAHMASTYLPADIYARFLRICGQPVRLISATDMHGAWVKKELKTTGRPQEELLEEWHQRYKDQLRTLNIQFDYYGRTDTQALRELVQGTLTRLREKGFISQRHILNYFCTQCLEPLPKRFRLVSQEHSRTGKMKLDYDAALTWKCAFCGNDDVAKEEAEHWVLDLNRGRTVIADQVQQQNDYIRKYLETILQSDLPEWDFTRENYIGIPLPFGDGNQYVYLWYQSLLGYISLLPDGADVSSIRFSHFIGKNILYYHGIVWPLLLNEGLEKMPQGIAISARGFLDLAASDHCVTDIAEASRRFEIDYLRFYMAYQTPDSMSDFRFTEEDFKNVVNNVLCSAIGGFFNRCRSILRRVDFVPETRLSNNLFDDSYPAIRAEMEKCRIRVGLLGIQTYLKQCGAIISREKMYKDPTRDQLGLIAHMMASGLCLMSAVTPTIVVDFNIFEGLNLNSLDDLSRLPGKRILPKGQIWQRFSQEASS